MYKRMMLCLISLGITLLCGCEKEKKEITWNEGNIEVNVDVTQDGHADRINVNIQGFVDHDWEEGENIRVYSGDSGKKLWSDLVAEQHVAQKGVYLYKDSEGSHLMVWNPYTSMGGSVYQYKIFDVTEDGKEKIIKENKFSFDKYSPKESDEEDLKQFADEVNQYLKEAYVILDTNGDIPIYSTSDEKITNTYNPDEDIAWIRESLQRE